MLVGYARLSTLESDAEMSAQVKTLRAAGVEKIFTEKCAATGERRTLDIALDYVREGDALVVTELDRLARSVTHLGEIIAHLEARNVSLRVVKQFFNSETAEGKLALKMMAAVSEFDGAMSRERAREDQTSDRIRRPRVEPSPIGLSETVTDEEFAAIAASA